MHAKEYGLMDSCLSIRWGSSVCIPNKKNVALKLHRLFAGVSNSLCVYLLHQKILWNINKTLECHFACLHHFISIQLKKKQQKSNSCPECSTVSDLQLHFISSALYTQGILKINACRLSLVFSVAFLTGT